MNMNDPSNNLKRRLDLLDAKVYIDYKRVKPSKNTDRAYNSKVLEFLQFCDVSQPDEKNPRVITPLKVFEFLYYCAFRKKKKTYCKKNNLANGHVVRFKYEEYLDVLDMAHNGVDEHINVIGFGQWNQYYCAIKRHVGHQYSTKESDLKKEDLVTEQISKLINVVSYR